MSVVWCWWCRRQKYDEKSSTLPNSITRHLRKHISLFHQRIQWHRWYAAEDDVSILKYIPMQTTFKNLFLPQGHFSVVPVDLHDKLTLALIFFTARNENIIYARLIECSRSSSLQNSDRGREKLTTGHNNFMFANFSRSKGINRYYPTLWETGRWELHISGWEDDM